MIELHEPYTVDGTENDTDCKPLRMGKEAIWNRKQISKHNLGFIVLVFVERGRLLRAEQVIVHPSKNAELFAYSGGNKPPGPSFFSEGTLRWPIGVN